MHVSMYYSPSCMCRLAVHDCSQHSDALLHASHLPTLIRHVLCVLSYFTSMTLTHCSEVKREQSHEHAWHSYFGQQRVVD